MKQIDKRTEHRLRWLFLPVAIIMVVNLLDLFLNWNLESESWGSTAIMIGLAIPLSAYCIAAVRQKCWGYLAVILAIAAIAYLNMSNVFVEMLVPEE